jgi:hypothetical protein
VVAREEGAELEEPALGAGARRLLGEVARGEVGREGARPARAVELGLRCGARAAGGAEEELVRPPARGEAGWRLLLGRRSRVGRVGTVARVRQLSELRCEDGVAGRR